MSREGEGEDEGAGRDRLRGDARGGDGERNDVSTQLRTISGSMCCWRDVGCWCSGERSGILPRAVNRVAVILSHKLSPLVFVSVRIITALHQSARLF